MQHTSVQGSPGTKVSNGRDKGRDFHRAITDFCDNSGMSSSSTVPRPFVIGLAGPSGSGKSTAAKRIGSRLNAHVISMETYTADSSHLPLSEREKLNYDLPEALDVRLLAEHVREYAAGHSIESPIYDFAQHMRVRDRTPVPPKPVLIVEGILALHFAELRPYYGLSIYLDAPDDLCFRRRQVRDITERQRSLDLIRWQWENTVHPAAQRYLLPSKAYADAVIDAKDDLATVEKKILEIVQPKVAIGAAR